MKTHILAVDLADEMGIPRHTLYDHIRKGWVKAEKINGRTLIMISEAERWINEYPLIKRRPRTAKTAK